MQLSISFCSVCLNKPLSCLSIELGKSTGKHSGMATCKSCTSLAGRKGVKKKDLEEPQTNAVLLLPLLIREYFS